MNNFQHNAAPESYAIKKWRLLFMSLMMMAITVLLMWRAVDLNVFNKDFLQQQGDARYLRVVPVPAHRGMITDRYGEPLAISTPVASVWANPKELRQHPEQWQALANILQIDVKEVADQMKERGDKEFVYLKRQVNPDVVKRLKALNIPGVDFQGEYRRYYPAAEVTSHLLGFTNIDDQGQEGLELAYDNILKCDQGPPGACGGNRGTGLRASSRPGRDSEHRPTDSISGVPRIKSRRGKTSGKIWIGGSNGCQNRRDPGDGQSAGV